MAKRSDPTPHGSKAPTEKHEYNEDGVDLTLIRWFLTLTPAERLTILQENVRALALMREGYRVPEFPRLVHVKGNTVREIEERKLAILRATLAEKTRLEQTTHPSGDLQQRQKAGLMHGPAGVTSS